MVVVAFTVSLLLYIEQCSQVYSLHRDGNSLASVNVMLNRNAVLRGCQSIYQLTV